MKISVIITAFNDEKFISRTIDSFLEQNYENKELLIIDDISNDKTHEIIASYQEKFPKNIRWIKERDYGIANARNIALKHVSGDVIGFLGADDILHRGLFEEMSYYVEKNPVFDVMYFNNYRVGDDVIFNNLAAKKATFENLLSNSFVISGGSFYYRREVFKHSQFNEKNRYCIDFEFNLSLASNKKIIFYPINIAAVFNWECEKKISSANRLRKNLELAAVKMKYAKNLSQQFKIFWHSKKLIFRNRTIFHQISRSI